MSSVIPLAAIPDSPSHNCSDRALRRAVFGPTCGQRSASVPDGVAKETPVFTQMRDLDAELQRVEDKERKASSRVLVICASV